MVRPVVIGLGGEPAAARGSGLRCSALVNRPEVCTGIALGLLDEWLSGRDPAAPAHLAARIRLPAGQWTGARAATDVLALAAKGRAFRSLHTLTVRQGGHHLLHGSAFALAAATITWARQTGTEPAELTATMIR